MKKMSQTISVRILVGMVCGMGYAAVLNHGMIRGSVLMLIFN